MKIAALRMHNVKRFAGRGVAIEGIGDGVNVLTAVNEFGKSTSFEALHALFFQPHSSTSGDVRNLRPYSGGNPVVEADIETESGRFRITKQFYGRGSARVVDLANGRLIAQADEAENFIADLVRGGTAGPAGLLWVRQGVTGIEKRKSSEEESERNIRAGLLESVQGEIEAVTGGRRMAEIMATTEEALARLVTATGRPKGGERYATEIDERDRLKAEEQKLGADVALLRDALDKRASAAKRLAELDRPDDRKARQVAIDAAQTSFDAAKSQAETLRAAEAELRLAKEQRDNAQREHEAFRLALERAADLTAKLGYVEGKRAEALEQRDVVDAIIAKARVDSDAADKEVEEGRALLARLDAALKARDAADRRAELQQRLEMAEAAREKLEAGEAALTLLRLPETAVAELETLDIEIARLKAVAEAGRSTVTIAYEAQAAPVRLDGVALNDGEPRGYDGQAELAIPGIGRVTLRSTMPVRSDDRRRQADERRRTLLASIGVDDLTAARKRLADARHMEGDLREMRARLSLLAPNGLPALREELLAWQVAADDVLELKSDPDQVRAAQQAAETRQRDARQAWRNAEPKRTIATDAVVSAQTEYAALEAERKQVDDVLGPDAARAGHEAHLADTLTTLDRRLVDRQTNVARLQAEALDLVSADATLRRVRSVAAAAENEIGRLREDIAALTARIATQSDAGIEEKWRESIDALDAAQRRVASYEKEVAILQRLRGALDAARSQARETYLQPVMNELRPLLGLLFDKVDISFDEKTLLPQRILRQGQEEDVERLSGGMREQLSVLTRLAFARLLAKDGRPAPVILDDALVYSDDERIEKMFDALHRQAREQQIIVLSCRQRAFQTLGGHRLEMSDWKFAE